MFEVDGKSYARVTEILSAYSDFSKVPPEVLEKKKIIGQNVHVAIKDDVDGEFPVVSDEECGYFESYRKWYGRVLPEFIQSEKRYFCDKKMLSGCIDGLVIMPGSDAVVLIDFKTSAQESSETWKMQAHLYYYLIKESGEKVSDKFLFIKLDKTGELPKVFQYDYDSNIHAKCMEAVDSYWEKDKKV